MSKRLNSEWQLRSLASLGTYLNGFAFKPEHWGENGLPIVRIRELLDPAVEPDRYEGSAAKSFLIEDGDLIFSWSATLAALFWNRGPAYLNQHLFKVTPAPDVDIQFLCHLINFHLDNLAARSHGTTMKHVTRGDLDHYFIRLPGLDEQRAIAEVLDTLDDHIQLIESASSKLRAVFISLLGQLMTRGVRPDSVALGDAALEFGEATIRLPKRWTVEPICQLLASVDPAMRSGPFGSALLKHELVESGVPLLGIDNVHVDRFVSDFQRFVTPAKGTELSRYRVRPADVMITIMGTVGRSCLIPEDIGFALSSKHVWTLTFDEARYRPYLVSLQLNHAPWARAHLRRDEQGGIMSAIRSDTLKTLILPTPPIDEQLEIETILKTVESKIDNEEKSLQKLRTLKAGLVADLLTGRVRVPTEVAS